jgi:hypothetical protein
MTTIFMVFTCAFLNGAPHNFQERDSHNCYPARWINHGAPHKFSTIEDCKAAIARASDAGIIPRDTRLHRAFGDDYWEDTKCFSKTVPTWQLGNIGLITGIGF